jgi:hypothetical protein
MVAYVAYAIPAVVVLWLVRRRLQVAHRFTLRFHETARLMLVMWRQTLGATDEERKRRYRGLLAAMKARLADFDGKPPEAVLDTRFEPPLYWWFFANALFLFVRTESPPPARGWWDVRRRLKRWASESSTTVTVIGLTPVGPSGAVAPLPGSSID